MPLVASGPEEVIYLGLKDLDIVKELGFKDLDIV